MRIALRSSCRDDIGTNWLRSFVVIWLVIGGFCTSVSVGIEFGYSSLPCLPLAWPTLDNHAVSQARHEDAGWSEPRDSGTQEQSLKSLCAQRHISRDIPLAKPSGETYIADKFWNRLNNQLAEDQGPKLSRRVVSTSNSGSSGSSGSSGTRSADTAGTTRIYIVPYYRGRLPSSAFLPFHWAIFLTSAPDASGTAHQLRGLPGEFRYEGPERPFVITHSRRKRQELLIGRILDDEISELENVIAQVPISKSKVGYNCQTWTEMVLQRLNQRGWLSQSPISIVSCLRQLEVVLPNVRSRRD